MTRHRNFEVQLENFRRESATAAQYIYAEMAIQHAASKSKKLLSRRSQNHHIYITPGSHRAIIHSDPVEVELVNGTDLSYEPASRLGAHYENFEKFWSYAKLLGKNSVAAALPSRT